MSTSTLRWRATLVTFTAIIIGGVILVVLLAAGLADPPRAGPLRWQAESPQDWTAEHADPDLTLYAAPVDLPPVFTLELTAANSGPPESAWGVVFEGSGQRLTILIDNQGYVSVSSDNRPHWAEFLHSHPKQINKLYVNVASGGVATLRLNDEVAWEGVIDATHWSVAEYRQSAVHWGHMMLYYE